MTVALRARAIAAVAAATSLLAALAAPAQAAPVDLQPEDLDRGADISVAHIDRGDFVLGDRRVDVGGASAQLIGKARNGWLVGTSDASGNKFRIVRVNADNTTRVLKRGSSFYEAQISQNGRFFAQPERGTRKSTPIRVFSTRTGALKTQQNFANFPQVVGMQGPRVLLSTWVTGDTGIKSWDINTGVVTPVTKRAANLVDVRNDLLASYTGNPYSDGCMVVSRLSDPAERLWRSCSERVTAFSPDGQRMATVSILADGIGPSVVWEREIDGTLLAEYTTSWFGGITFEDDTNLLLDVNGDTRAATVRCREGECVNATDPGAVSSPRASATARFGALGAPAGALPRAD